MTYRRERSTVFGSHRNHVGLRPLTRLGHPVRTTTRDDERWLIEVVCHLDTFHTITEALDRLVVDFFVV